MSDICLITFPAPPSAELRAMCARLGQEDAPVYDVKNVAFETNARFIVNKRAQSAAVPMMLYTNYMHDRTSMRHSSVAMFIPEPLESFDGLERGKDDKGNPTSKYALTLRLDESREGSRDLMAMLQAREELWRDYLTKNFDKLINTEKLQKIFGSANELTRKFFNIRRVSENGNSYLKFNVATDGATGRIQAVVYDEDKRKVVYSPTDTPHLTNEDVVRMVNKSVRVRGMFTGGNIWMTSVGGVGEVSSLRYLFIRQSKTINMGMLSGFSGVPAHEEEEEEERAPEAVDTEVPPPADDGAVASKRPRSEESAAAADDGAAASKRARPEESAAAAAAAPAKPAAKPVATAKPTAIVGGAKLPGLQPKPKV